MMEQKKSCELCGRLARMFCESDQASLCWVCDKKVHSANFIVAKHSRTLLCHVCQSPTPWAAAGPKLSTTVSVCERCFDSHGKDSQMSHREDIEDEEYSVNGNGGDGEEEDEIEDEEHMDDDDYEDVEEEEEEDDDDDDDDDDEEGENQVVPWSCDSPPSPPPPAASSSSSGEESAPAAGGGCLGSGAKRVWDSAFSNESDDEIGCASSQGISTTLAASEEAPSSASFHRSKQQRFNEGNGITRTAADESAAVESESTSASIVHSLRRLQRNAMSEDSSAALVLGICRLSRC